MQFRENLCKNTTFFSTILLIFLFINPSSIKSSEKGSPYIQQITLNNLGINNNNFSALIDNNGIIYVKNSNGLLKYNGNNWELFKLSTDFDFTLGNDNVIYVVDKNKFGLLKTENNKHKFHSLLDSIKKIGNLKNVVNYNGSIFLTNQNSVFRWKNKELNKVISLNSEPRLFNINHILYVFSVDKGLLEFKNNEFIKSPNSDFFKGKDIISILPFNEQLLIKTKKEKGFYIVDNNSITPFKTNADDFIYNGKFTHACQLSDGNYAVGTEQNGIVIFNKSGNVTNIVNENSGLYNTAVNFLIADQSNNLWALHNHGISRIEFPSAYRYFNKSHGLKGKVNDVFRFRDNLYVATSNGVFSFSKETSNPNKFIPVENLSAKCFKFHVRNNELFVLSNKGIYKINNNRAIVFFNRHGEEVTCVWHSKKNPQNFYLGHTNGFSSIRFTNEIFIINDKSEKIKDKVTCITENNDGKLWLVVNYKEIWKVDPNDNSFAKNYTSMLGEVDWIVLNPLKDELLFSTSKGVFQFNETNEQFYPEQVLNLSEKFKKGWIYPIVEDQNNIWVNVLGQGDLKNTTLMKPKDKELFTSYNPLPFNRIKDFYVSRILPDEDNIVWFCGVDGLVKLNLNETETTHKKLRTILNKISIDNDSTIFLASYGNNSKPSFYTDIEFHLNTIQFEYSTNSYVSENQVLYQFRLIGLDSLWSEWNESNSKEFINLYEGKYTFELRSKSIRNEISDVISYSFKIKPPIYRSKVAFVLYVILITLIVILIGKWRAYYFARERFRLENIIHERTEEVVIQKEKADNLLERVLPKNTAKELKSGRKAGPYHYNMVTVLFSDIQGFTKISEQMESELLIDELDRFFLQFDTVVEKYNIEKIKTIGDAYMCAGGIPTKNRTNPVEVVLAAIEMQNFMKELKSKADESTKHIWDLRIGIDTGPVIAGVLGKSKISYDIWGGTVNTASRMEASSETGKINVTENTYMLIKDFFICQYRGKMPVKYKGEIDMYFVEGFKPELSSDKKRLIPNDNFFTQLQLLRVNDVEEFVLSKLEEGLPDNLYYHNVKHTIDVVTQVELIGRSEGVSEKEILILKTAALFHDIGHLVNYDTHEEESVKLAKKILPEYKYTPSQVETICELIQVTQMPPQPKNLLEEIMCDADLDYLGRTDFVPVSINLYKELAERNKIDSILEWNKMQQQFIKNHTYFTKTARTLREVHKKKQLELIQDEIKNELEQLDDN